MTHTNAYLEAHSQLCNAKLQEALRFQSKDLALNRDKGIITQAQKHHIRMSVYPERAVMVVFGLILVAFSSWMGSHPASASGRSISTSNPIFAIVGLGLIVYGIMSLLIIGRELTQGVIAFRHGPVTIDKPWSSKKHHLVIDNHTFMVEKPICEAFNSGEIYTIYYLRTAQLILSAEHHLAAPDEENAS